MRLQGLPRARAGARARRTAQASDCYPAFFPSPGGWLPSGQGGTQSSVLRSAIPTEEGSTDSREGRAEDGKADTAAPTSA